MIRLTLPYPPSANRYWRVFRGRAVMSDEARSYKQSVRLLAGTVEAYPKDAQIVLTLRIYRPRKSGDLSNRIKVLEDALNGVAFADDSQIVTLHAERYEDKHNPRVEVEVSETSKAKTLL